MDFKFCCAGTAWRKQESLSDGVDNSVVKRFSREILFSFFWGIEVKSCLRTFPLFFVTCVLAPKQVNNPSFCEQQFLLCSCFVASVRVTSLKVALGSYSDVIAALMLSAYAPSNSKRKHSCQSIFRLGWHSQREANMDERHKQIDTRRRCIPANSSQMHPKSTCIPFLFGHTLHLFCLVVPTIIRRK